MFERKKNNSKQEKRKTFHKSWLFIIFLIEYLSEASAIDCKYVKMTELQDFYKASSFTDPIQKQAPEVFFKNTCS